jgi:hypothetical protein
VFLCGDFSKKKKEKTTSCLVCKSLCKNTQRELLSRRAEPALHGGDFLPPCEINSLDNMLNLKQFLRDTYKFDMEDESFDYDLADIEELHGRPRTTTPLREISATDSSGVLIAVIYFIIFTHLLCTNLFARTIIYSQRYPCQSLKIKVLP